MLSTPDICCSMGVATDSATALRHAGSLSAPERARLLERHAAGCNLTNEVSVSISSGTEALALWQELGNVEAQARVHLLLNFQYWKAGQKAFADQHVARAIRSDER